MKKLVLLGLFSVCLAFPQTTFAQEEQTASGSISSQSSSSEEVSSSSSSIVESTTNTTATEETNSSVEKDETTKKNAPIEKEYNTSPAKTYSKGDAVKPIDFKSYLEQMSGFGLYNFTFPAGLSYTTETVGLNDAQVIASDERGQEYIFHVKYLVKNNVATLKIWNVHYDPQTKTLSGNKSPNADLYFYKVGLPSEQPVYVYPSSNSETFSFQITADFEPGRLMTIIAYSPGATEYSEPYQFKIPLLDNGDSSGSSDSTDRNTSSPSETTASTTKPSNTAQKKTLPSTGETSSGTLIFLGIAALAVCGVFIYKRVKN